MTTSAGGDDGIFGDADKNRAPLIDLQGGEASLGDVERGNVVVRIEMPIEREELRQIRGQGPTNGQRRIHGRIHVSRHPIREERPGEAMTHPPCEGP
jgi:hypothetical protein